jgi:hypothetical protein
LHDGWRGRKRLHRRSGDTGRLLKIERIDRDCRRYSHKHANAQPYPEWCHATKHKSAILSE